MAASKRGFSTIGPRRCERITSSKVREMSRARCTEMARAELATRRCSSPCQARISIQNPQQ